MPPCRIDLAVLLGKTPPSSSSEAENPPLEAAQPPPLSQSLVFSNSKQGGSLSQPPSGTPYSQHSMVRRLSETFSKLTLGCQSLLCTPPDLTQSLLLVVGTFLLLEVSTSCCVFTCHL